MADPYPGHPKRPRSRHLHRHARGSALEWRRRQRSRHRAPAQRSMVTTLWHPRTFFTPPPSSTHSSPHLTTAKTTQIHTLGFGLMVGADIYDCVIVINNEKGMEGFKRVRCTLGGEISATAGPVGAGATLDSEIHKRQAPLWTYMKSRGFYVGAQVDGTIVLERSEENAKFYGRKGVRCHEILAGQVSAPMGSTGMLHETLKLAEGRQYDEGLLNKSGVMDGMSPGDAEVEEPTKEELRRREGMGL